jgi:predicted P-loop ATPase
MLQDHDLKLLKGYLVERFDFEANVSAIEEAVTNVAFRYKFHPVREYLEGLKGTWDRTPRVETWLHDYAGVPLNNYTKAVARKVLCAAVMRIMRPGIKFDHILVLEGPQNAGKSQLVKALGGRWSADFSVDPSNKDTVDSMQGKWFVEMAEMSVLNRTEMSALKAFVTRDTDRIRQAYGRLTREFPRQCIFIGTINPEADGAYLTDPTGNRRFWPVVTGRRINFRGLSGVRNQLFAEAMSLVEKGEALYLDNEKLEEEARVVVADRHASDPWVERIGAWLHEDREAKAKEFVTARDIYIDALGGIDKQLVRREVIRIANVMRSLGWKAGTKWAGQGAVVRGYHRPADAVEGGGESSDLGDLV